MTSVEQRFRRYADEYRQELTDVIARAVDDAELVGTSLQEMLDYQMSTGGKRLRALLPLMVADALDEPPDRVLPFGAACELIHNATLIHDDLQDGDRLRRGQPAIWVRYGSSPAINLGDALLYLAPLCLEYADVEEGLRWQVASMIFRQVLGVVDGQEREFALDATTATHDDYVKMVVGKTGGLFCLPIVGAARLCGASEAIVEALQLVSRELGVLFQIQDDIVDLYGEKGRECRGGDLREGKISALVIAFGSRAPSSEVQRLHQILEAGRDETTEDDVAWAIEQFRRRGALSSALENIAGCRRRALAVQGLGDHQELRDLIDGLVDLFLKPIEHLL